MKNMKVPLLFIAICFVLELNAQDSAIRKPQTQKLFVRLYNTDSKKIAKGDLLEGSDSTVEVLNQRKSISFPVNQISFIKTRHSAGHAILVGAIIGTTTGIILIAAGGA